MDFPGIIFMKKYYKKTSFQLQESNFRLGGTAPITRAVPFFSCARLNCLSYNEQIGELFYFCKILTEFRFQCKIKQVLNLREVIYG